MIDVCILCVCVFPLWCPRLRCCFSLTLSEPEHYHCYYLLPGKSFPGTVVLFFISHYCYGISISNTYMEELQFLLYYLKFLNTCWESASSYHHYICDHTRSHEHDYIQVYKRLYYFHLLLF